MLRLELHTANGAKELDTKDASLELTFAESDVQDISASRSPHSLAFQLPFSEVNNEALEFFEVIDQSAETRRTIPCDVYDDGQLVMAGNLSVRSADLQRRTYDCVIYSRRANIWQEMKDTTWQDVFTGSDGNVTTSLDFDLNPDNILASQNPMSDITDGSVGTGVIWIPPQWPVFRLRDTPSITTIPKAQTLEENTGLQRLLATDYLPAIRVWYLLDQLFLHFGYTIDKSVGLYTDTFDLSNAYITIARDDITFRPYFQALVQPVSITGYNSNILLGQQSGWSNAPYLLFCSSVGAGYFDPDGFFSGGADLGGFVPPISGAFNMRLKMPYVATGTGSGYVGIQPLNMSTAEYGELYYQEIEGSTSGTIVIDWQYVVDTPNQVNLPAMVWSVPSGGSVTLNLAASSLQMISYVGDSPKVSVPNSLGSDTCDKWLKAVMQQYNIVATLNHDAKTCSLHYYKDFYERDVDNAKDWTEKADKSQPMKLTNNLESLKRSILFTDADGEDGQSVYAQEEQGYKYTDFKYKPNLSLAQGEQVIGGYFAPPRFTRPYDSLSGYSLNFATDWYLGIQYWKRITNASGAAATSTGFESKMIVHRGTYYAQNLTPIYVSTDSNNTQNTIVEYWSAVEPVADGVVQSWGPKTTYDSFVTNGLDSLFEFGYERQLKQMYSRDARVLECQVHLSSDDINQLNYADLIAIDGTYYYISEISGYVVGANKPCRVKLRKFLNAEQEESGVLTCNVIYAGIETWGQVIWEDRDGNPTTGTEACCEYYGGGNWTWNPYTSVCMADTQVGEDFPDNDADFLPNHRGLYQNLQYTSDEDTTNRPLDSLSRKYRIRMTASTKSNVASNAKTGDGLQYLSLPQDCIATWVVTYQAKVVSTTDFGKMEFGVYDATARVEGGGVVKVDTDGVITKNGDSSSTSSALSVSSGTGVPQWFVECVGHTGTDMEWVLDLELTIVPIVYDTTPSIQSISTQDAQPLVTQVPDVLSIEG